MALRAAAIALIAYEWLCRALRPCSTWNLAIGDLDYVAVAGSLPLRQGARGWYQRLARAGTAYGRAWFRALVEPGSLTHFGASVLSVVSIPQPIAHPTGGGVGVRWRGHSSGGEELPAAPFHVEHGAARPHICQAEIHRSNGDECCHLRAVHLAG